MAIDQSEDRKAGESLFGLQQYVVRFVVVVTLLLVAIPLLPGLISNLAYSFSGDAPKLYWYLSRSAGFVAITILWVSMVLGLGISNKMARIWPGAPAAFAIHEFVSLLGLAFSIYHGLVLMGDHFVDFSLPRLLVPFSIAYETLWVGLGQVAFYVWALVAASFYIRRRIGQKTWRLIHYTNFATYTLGLLHGIFSGTDSGISWVRWYYLATGGSLLVLVAYRLYEAASGRNFSLRTRIEQRLQAFTQAATIRELRMLSSIEKRIQAYLLRNRNLLAAASGDPVDTTESEPLTPPPVVVDPPEQAAANEKPPFQTSETPVAEDQAPIAVSPPTEVPAPPVAEEQVLASVPVKVSEQAPEKNKIRIRIYKEPPKEQVILEPQRSTRSKQIDIDPLLRKLKKFFRTTPFQPEKPDEKPRVRILED